MAEKAETKIGLLLSPFELFQNCVVIELIHIYKTKNTVDYKTSDVAISNLRKHFPSLAKDAKDALKVFSLEAITDTQTEIKKLAARQSPAVDRQKFVHAAVVRHVHKMFETLKPFSRLFKWYQKIPGEKAKTFKVAPGYLSPYKPQLKFHVTYKDKHLGLETEIVINGASYNLKDFSRYQFLLLSNNEFFLLSYKDFQTLEWLEENKPAQFQSNAADFSQKILVKLETDYAVNRNNYFDKKQITATPVNRVLLSELNNAFLMLTPQWSYDGFIVEGVWKETYDTTDNGEAVSIVRNKNAETEFSQLLLSLHPNFVNQKNGYYYLSFADAQKKQWFFKAYHNLLEQGIELVGMDMLQHFRYSQFKPETEISVQREEQSRVLMQMKVAFGNEEIRLAELQKMLLAGQKSVLLKDGSLGVLHDEWLQQYAAIIKHGKINKDEIEVSRFMAISHQPSSENGEALKPFLKEQWWQKWKQWQTGNTPIYDLPATVKAVLRPYQQKGFEWLTLLAEAGAGGCLADDMGLGKTLQTICFLAYSIGQNPKSVNIIVCPSSLIYNWQQELQKFAPSISAVVYHGALRNVDVIKSADHSVIITSYGTARADAEVLLSLKYGVAVIDESHNIKNPSAQITTVVNSLQANTRIALSGTPVVNNTFDLYAQLNFAVPGMFGGREFFKREYADAIDRYHDEEKIKSLQKLTAPFILRRTKEQVAKDLPDKTEIILWCKMHSRQQDVYNEIKGQVRSSLFLNIKNEGLNKSKLAVMQGMLRLRQICNSPLLLPGAFEQTCSDSIKTEVLLGELSNILKEHKALVFSQFSSMLHLLTKECDKAGIRYYHFDGQTPPAQRTEMVNAFQQKDNTTNLFLISLKAGNTGLTLTAADYVFLFDPWWNTAVEQQAVDRTHRIGQTKNVFAYKLICKDTIEEKIIQLQKRKKQLAEELITEDDSFVKSLTEEDIEYLFS